MQSKRFEIERVSGQPVADEELIADLKQVAAETGKNTVGMKEYRRLGRYDDSTASTRFGSWNQALKAAGLETSVEHGFTDDQLFENILALWSHYGRQPRKRELALPPSQISQSPYMRRFKSWYAALKRFVEFANSRETDAEIPVPSASVPIGRRTPRDPSLRLRWKVLQRDRFTCRACGASPANISSVELRVDHIIPWSKGGETTLDNLQTLCDPCNLGKGNLLEGTG